MISDNQVFSGYPQLSSYVRLRKISLYLFNVYIILFLSFQLKEDKVSLESCWPVVWVGEARFEVWGLYKIVGFLCI
jgi:hypothetical protein